MSRTSTAGGAPWRVGVLYSVTGVTALAEAAQLRGTLMAIAEINGNGGVDGREIVPVLYDPASDPSAYARLARRLLLEDDVETIFGGYTSSSRKAMLPVLERLDGLLWYPTLYEGFEYSPNVIYTGAAPNQNLLRLCSYIVEVYGPRVFCLGCDYIYPRACNRLMSELLAGCGGKVVGEAYIGLNAQPHELRPVMRTIRDRQPDVIFSTVVGDATVHTYRAYHEAGFNPRVMPIASLTTTEAELHAMGHDVGEHHISAASYFQGVGGAANKAFVAAFQRRYGTAEPTCTGAESAYFQVHLFAGALARSGTAATKVLRQSVLGTTICAPQGEVTINASCNHADLWTRIGRANRHGQFDLVHESAGAVAADPYLIGYGRAAMCQ